MKICIFKLPSFIAQLVACLTADPGVVSLNPSSARENTNRLIMKLFLGPFSLLLIQHCWISRRENGPQGMGSCQLLYVRLEDQAGPGKEKNYISSHTFILILFFMCYNVYCYEIFGKNKICLFQAWPGKV